MESIVVGGLVLLGLVLLAVALYRQKEAQKKREAERLAAAATNRASRRKRSSSTTGVTEPAANADDTRPVPTEAPETVAVQPVAPDQDQQDREARRQAVTDVTEASSHDPVSALRAALDHNGPAAAPVRQSDTHQALILIVDDSKSAREVAKRTLKDLPYRLVTAENGIDAINKLEQEKPALVLTDVDMPQLDGFGLLRRMRNDLRFTDIPVIMMTGHLHLHVQIGASEGVNGFVTKPYDPQDLIEQVTFLLEE